LVLLHNEIVDFASLMEPRKDEIEEREEVVRRIKSLVTETFGKDKCEVHTFGSQATGLSLPTSDIDLVVNLKTEESGTTVASEKGGGAGGGGKDGDTPESGKDREEREMNDWKASSGSSSSRADGSAASPLRRLGDALRRRWPEDLTYLEVVENTRVPIVKFALRPHRGKGGSGGDGVGRGDHNDNGEDSDPEEGIQVDVCFNQGSGVESANLVRTFMEAMSPLRPLTFVLKYFTSVRRLNEPYTGGVGSFLLQMMIVSFLQHREREERTTGRGGSTNLCLGSLLLEFLELYGLDFNYVLTGVSVRSDGSYFPKGSKNRREDYWQPQRQFSLGLENPYEPKSDVGRASYRMQLVQKSFEVAFRTLLCRVSDPHVPCQSILASILPPTGEMTRRAALRNVEKAWPRMLAEGGRGRGGGGVEGGRDSPGSDMDVSSEEERGYGERRQKRRRRR